MPPTSRSASSAQRLNALVALCESPRCRRQTLLAYFGETTRALRQLRSLRDGVDSFDGTIEAQKLLSAIARTGERFGTEHLINLLVGEAQRSDPALRHDQLKTFGVGKDRSSGMALAPAPDLRRAASSPSISRNTAAGPSPSAATPCCAAGERIELRSDVLMSRASAAAGPDAGGRGGSGRRSAF